MKLKGSEIVIKTLIEQGVDTIFGYPGGAVLNIYDSLYEYEKRKEITHILTSHEQGATHAADGYARSTGKTGVVLATSGPGATNTVTGIATAYMDSIPMVVITGNVPQSLIGKDAFQEIYITGITMPITKHNFLVKDINKLADVIRKAFVIANSGRKGPVLIDITKDVTAAECEWTQKEKKNVKIEEFKDDKIIEKIAKEINNSIKPVMFVGGGILASNAYEEVVKLAKLSSIPTCNSIMALGAVGEIKDLQLGMLGMHGRVSTNYAIENSDLLIAVGTRFSDRVALNPKKFAPNAKIIHIEIDESEINKNVLIDYSVVGDAKSILQKLLPHIKKQDRSHWINVIKEWHSLDYKPKDAINDEIKPHNLIKTIVKNESDDTIFVTDVGQHQMWAAQYSDRVKPRTFITSGGLGTMGFGLGAAIGAKIGNPDKEVVLITGDGSFHMNMNETATAVAYSLGIKIVIMNNTSLGMPRQWQEILYNQRYATSDFIRKTNYVKLAEAFGAVGYSCYKQSDFEKIYKEALKIKNVPVVIECLIDKNEIVLPMIPAGGTIKDMIVG